MRHLVFTLAITSFLLAQAHGTHAHDSPAAVLGALPPSAIPEISQSYLNDIRPIFEKKCFDCHSSFTKFPWYYPVPGIRQLIDKDIREAQEHLDLSSGYPFKSHATLREDLTAIADEIDKNDMPPLRYRRLHPQSAVTEAEKSVIHRWVEQSLSRLGPQ
jgi:hypothetical protein